MDPDYADVMDDTKTRAPPDSTKRARVRLAYGLSALAAIAIVMGVLGGMGILSPSSSSSSSDTSATANSLPALKPPVQASAPRALDATRTKLRLSALSVDEITERFFNPDGGPANLYNLLDSVDGRIQGVNTRWSLFAACINSTSYTNVSLAAWTGDVVLKVSCAEQWESLNNFTGFILFSRTALNDTHYVFDIYERGPETAVAARSSYHAVLVNETTREIANLTVDRVELWYSVGLSNLNGSHGVVHLLALPTEGVFEMAVAGNGLGFCGAHLRAEGSVLFSTGSADMGATCSATDTLCSSVNSTESTSGVNCSGVTYALTPLGRGPYTGPSGTPLGGSAYANNTIVLRANGTDDTLFGPATLPDGLSPVTPVTAGFTRP